jgi:hypothetical protein
MKCKTREITIELRPDNIVETTVNEGITELGLEGVDDVLLATNKVHRSTDSMKAALICAPSFYVKKEVLKRYAGNRDVELVAAAILTSSFSAQIIGNLLVTIRERIMKMNNEELEPSKVFRDKEKAVNWLLEHLEKAKNEETL